MTNEFSELDELIKTYRGELSEKAKAITQAIALADLSQLQHLTHKLAGSSGTYGFGAISKHLRELEDQIIENRFQTLTKDQLQSNLSTWQLHFKKLIEEATS